MTNEMKVLLAPLQAPAPMYGLPIVRRIPIVLTRLLCSQFDLLSQIHRTAFTSGQ